MARISNQQIRFGDSEVKYYESVNPQTGEFWIVIPEDMYNKLQQVGMAGDFKNMYYRGKSYRAMTGLKLGDVEERFNRIIHEYNAGKIIAIKEYIGYSISTHCVYCVDELGEIHANGVHIKDYQFRGSERKVVPTPYNFEVYAQPIVVSSIELPNGTIKEKVDIMRERPGMTKDEIFLCSLIDMGKLTHSDIKRIEYTPKAAQFFAGIIRAICGMNEVVMELQDSDKLLGMIENNTPIKLLQ